MKRLLVTMAAILFLLTAAAAGESAHTVLYFYQNYCEYCTPEEDFAEKFVGLTGVSLEDCDFTAWNVVRDDGLAAWREAQRVYAIATDTLPMAIVDGKVYQGAGEMNSALVKAALSWHETMDSEILFLYTPACESCAEAEKVIASLPETVTFTRGDVPIESAVTITRVDASVQPGYAAALFQAYQVPDEDRVTPSVFYANRALCGIDAIERSLTSEVSRGLASGGIPVVEAQEDARAGSLLGSIGAGLVAGLNTCALSMLLLFLSLVLEADRRAIPAVIAYLGAKFVTYVLIGFVLMELLQRVNPTFLKPMAKWIMGVLGGGLAVVTLMDAVKAKRGALGEIKNQLPGGLRGKLRRVIARFTKTRWLVLGSVALGVIVAAGEFLCAGQLYLMRLIAAAQRGEGAMALLTYCIAFIAPSAVVCGIVLVTKSHLEASGFFAKHMFPIKLLTALAMIALIIVAINN